MSYFARFSPVRAFQDLRLFLSHRTKVELWFGVAAVAVTTIILAGFWVDSRVEPTYKRGIVYVESWPADRTDAQIIAQQKIDQAAREKRLAEIEAIRAKRRAEFKRVDDALDSWGL